MEVVTPHVLARGVPRYGAVTLLALNSWRRKHWHTAAALTSGTKRWRSAAFFVSLRLAPRATVIPAQAI